MAETVVVVESPAKAKTINKYLGRGFQVLASYGHVRDLPAKDGSVDPDHDFEMIWEVDAKSAKRLNEIAAAVKDAGRLILATDPDREGEAISWHVLEVLKKKGALKSAEVARVVFNAITKAAVLDAMAKPREIDAELVDAYRARRALDYLVGFTLSPVLWRKLPGSRSAGRVQSVALRLVVEREMEIEVFKPREYWSVDADLGAAEGPFKARLVSLDGEKLDRLSIATEEAARAAEAAIRGSALSVTSVETKPVRRNPAPPFITSTLQQEAARKLGFGAKRTMQIAQRLYEGIDVGGETVGLITYMRTDGVQLAPEAIADARRMVAKLYGQTYLPDAPRAYKSRAKAAQEAHEAIRPTALDRTPDSLKRVLDADHLKLYDLIWKRTLACQMEAAQFERTTVEIASADGRAGLRATGSVPVFDGFLAVYQEGRDDGTDEDGDARLPRIAEDERLTLNDVVAAQHFTEPPPRYSEASLVKKLEELGIGRPSTYASILSVLQERNYVRVDKGRFVPDDKGRLVTAFLSRYFDRYVQYDFTADLEDRLDRVAAGELDWRTLLGEFWRDFHGAVEDIAELRIGEVLDTLNEALGPHIFPPKEDGSNPRACPSCSTGTLSIRLGRFGAFIGCSNYPECAFTRPLAAPDAAAESGPRVIGHDPASGAEVSLRTGRFGPYLQLGEGGEGEKPPRASLPKGLDPEAIDLELALKLLSLPREVGTHPETGEAITAGLGRYGPYVASGGTYASLPSFEDVLSIGINRAVTVLAEKAQRGGRGGGRGRPAPKKEFGTTDDGRVIALMDGRYGPYVTDGKVNATVPSGTDADGLDLATALALITAKGGKAKPKRKAPARKAAGKSAKKPAPKKAAARKSAAKKPAAKRKAG